MAQHWKNFHYHLQEKFELARKIQNSLINSQRLSEFETNRAVPLTKKSCFRNVNN